MEKLVEVFGKRKDTTLSTKNTERQAGEDNFLDW
jgi:hypothetical protein